MRRKRRARAQLEARLRDEIAKAEADLAKLGRSSQAWQSINVHFSDTMPVFGSGGMAEVLLGSQAPTHRRSPIIPTRALPAFQAMEREGRRCRSCRAALAAGRPLIRQVRDHHPELFRRYSRQLKVVDGLLTTAVPPMLQETPAWSAAQRAATAAAALREIDSPLACFAAGAYLEQQRLLAWAARTLVPQAGKQARHRFREGVARGKFPDVEEAAARRAHAKAARTMHVERRTRYQPIWEAVRQAYKRLCATGRPKTAAARAIIENPEIREEIQAVAERTCGAGSPQPWGDRNFYSYSAIRRIVGL